MHKWTGLGQGINSGLCDCGFHGEIIFSACSCGEYHSLCQACWDRKGAKDDEIYADVYGALRYFHQEACVGECTCEKEIKRFEIRWQYLTKELPNA